MLNWLKNLFASSNDADSLGMRGENIAARYLRDKGYTIILRNFRCPTGEIDIIAKDAKTIVFVEVKTRTEEDVAPEAQVDEHKQHQLTKAGKIYLGRYGFPRPPARFDIVAVIWKEHSKPIIRHTQSAFEATF